MGLFDGVGSGHPNDHRGYWVRQEDGSLVRYNEDGTPATYGDGRPIVREVGEDGSLPSDDGGGYGSGGTYRQETDPETGEVYWVKEGTRNRVTDRRREKAQRQARVDYYGQRANEATQGIDDPWLELGDNVPTFEELMGDEYVSSLAEAGADPMAIEAQRAALQRMGQVARSGYTAEDRAVEQRARSNAAQFERQQREAIMQQAAARGMQGAGTTLGAQLAAQQGAANRNSQASADMAANAQRRALAALQMQNSAAGAMRGQSFNEDATRRSAADEANRYMIDGQRSASRDQFSARGQVAQGLSQARSVQGEQNRSAQQQAAGKKTKAETNAGHVTAGIGSIAEFF